MTLNSRSAFALLIVTSLTIVGCGNSETTPQPGEMLAIPQVYPGAGVRLEPPPLTSSPSITDSEAYDRYVEEGLYPNADTLTLLPPDIQLGLVSDDDLGEEQDDGTLQPRVQDVLSWIIIFHQTTFEGIGDPTAMSESVSASELPVPVDIVIAVHANTGAIVSAFSDNMAEGEIAGSATDGSKENTAPDTVLVDPLPGEDEASITLVRFSGEDDRDAKAALRYECRIDSQEFVPCRPTAVYPRLKGGMDHTIEVRAVDSDGLKDESPAIHKWSIV